MTSSIITRTLARFELELKVFLGDPERSKCRWLHLGPLSIYLRRSSRYIDRQMIDVIDLANISIDAKHQGKGLFTGILKILEVAAKRPIFVENVIGTSEKTQARLVSFLTRRGYIVLSGDPIAPCLLKEQS